MKEVGRGIKKLLGLSGALIIVFLVIHYWQRLEGLIILALGAAVPLIVGCIMAYVINILMNFYERWYDKLFQVQVAIKVRRIVCLILAFLSLGGIVFLVVNLVLPELMNCIASFIRLIPGALTTVVDIVGEEQILEMFPQLKEGINVSDITAQIEQIIKTIGGGIGTAVDSIVSVVSSVVSMVINVVIGLIFSLYVLLDKEKLGKQGKQLISAYLPKVADKVFYVIKVVDESFHSFIVGQVIEAVILGVLCVIGMLIFQFPYAVMIGVFIGFTALIPIAGAYLGAGVGAIMILTVSPIQAIQFLIFIVVLQQLEGNLIYPKVVGESIGLPGIWVLTAITVGGGVLGIGGMLLAVPLFAAAYRLIKEDVDRKEAELIPVVVKLETEDKKTEVEETTEE